MVSSSFMPSPCVSCHKASSDPFNFLLPCSLCSLSWHHRCHNPPVSDSEVVEIIKLFNAKQKKGVPNARLIWQCLSCLKGKAKAINPQLHNTGLPALPLGIKSTIQHLRSPPSKPTGANQDDAIVIEDDDDDVIILDEPPTPPAPLYRQERQLAASSGRSPNTVVHDRKQRVTFALHTSPIPSADSKDVSRNQTLSTLSAVHAASPRQRPKNLEIDSITDNIESPPLSEIQNQHSKKTKSTATRSDTGIVVIDDPYIDLATNDYEKHVSENGDEDSLEYLTPECPPATLLPQDLPQISSPADIVSGLTTKMVLLPTWITSRLTDSEPNLWDRRRLVIGRSSAEPRSLGQNSVTTVGRSVPISSMSSRRKKFEAQHLTFGASKSSRKASTQGPFFFSAEEWMRQMLHA